MKLNIMERLMVAQLLPEKGSFVNLGLIRKAKENVSFNEQEHKDFQIKATEDGRITWVDPGNSDKDIEFGDTVTEIVKKALKEMDSKEELEEKYFSLFEKFVGK